MFQRSDKVEGVDESFVYGNPDLDFTPVAGLGEELFNSMVQNKSNIAQIYVPRNVKETYGQLLTRCVKTAVFLKSRGIGIGDIISICSRNNLNSAVPYLAAQFIGAIVTSADPNVSREINAHLLKLVEPKMVFVSPETEEMIEGALEDMSLTESEIVVFGETKNNTAFSSIMEIPEIDNFKPTEIRNYGTIAVIHFSSGSTSLPKGICISHLSLLAMIASNNFSKVPPLALLQHATLYAITARTAFIINVMRGGFRILSDYFEPQEVWRLIDEYKIEELFMYPTYAKKLYLTEIPPNTDLSSLRALLFGGYLVTKEFIMKFRERLPGVGIHQTFSQTEMTGHVIGFHYAIERDVKKYTERPDAIGFTLPGYRWKIVDLDTEKNAKPYQHGELRLQSKYMMSDYYKLDSSGCFDSKGWYRTGDKMYYDEDLCLYFVSRIKEIIEYRGGSVIPANIEKVLLNHPEIKEAAVLAIPDEFLNDLPLAVVTPHDNSRLTTEDVIRYVDERVQDKERLRGGVKFMKELPLTASGKVAKKELKDMLLYGKLQHNNDEIS